MASPKLGEYSREKVQVVWTTPSDNGGLPILSYTLTYSSDLVSWSNITGLSTNWLYPQVVPIDRLSDILIITRHNGLLPNTTHYYAVLATNELGSGPWSAISDLSSASGNLIDFWTLSLAYIVLIYYLEMCGDFVCDASETCSTCYLDCGACGMFIYCFIFILF